MGGAAEAAEAAAVAVGHCSTVVEEVVEDVVDFLAGLAPTSTLDVSLFVRLRWSPLASPEEEVQHGQFFRTLERMEQRRFDFATPSKHLK